MKREHDDDFEENANETRENKEIEVRDNNALAASLAITLEPRRNTLNLR